MTQHKSRVAEARARLQASGGRFVWDKKRGEFVFLSREKLEKGKVVINHGKQKQETIDGNAPE